MTLTAKLFVNGGSQAVRLPKAARFDPRTKAVRVRVRGTQVILEPIIDAWPADLVERLRAEPATDLRRAPQGKHERRRRVR
jgi:virulence-associated protein VagC